MTRDAPEHPGIPADSGGSGETTSPELLAGIYSECRDRILRALSSKLDRNRELAEEALQEAWLRAVDLWPREGIPDNPGGWLYRVARNRAVDGLRRASRAPFEAVETRVLEGNRAPGAEPSPTSLGQRLELLSLCVRTPLPRDARIALALSLVFELEASELVDALQVERATAAQRVVRAKRALRTSGRLVSEDDDDAPELVAEVLFLAFAVGAFLRDSEVRGLVLRMADRLAEAEDATVEAPAVAATVHLLAAFSPDIEPGATLGSSGLSLWRSRRLEAGARHLVAALEDEAPPGPLLFRAALVGEWSRARSFASLDWARTAHVVDRLLRSDLPATLLLLRLLESVPMADPQAGLESLAERESEGRDVAADVLRLHLLVRRGNLDQAIAVTRDLEAGAPRNSDSRAAFRYQRRRLEEALAGSRGRGGSASGRS